MPSTKTYAISAAALVAVGLGAGAWYAATSGGGEADCGGGISTGGASIGGPFTLVSETGETTTAQEVVDGPTLIYFGYTFCPDICPVDAAVMGQATDLLAERGYDVKPVFVTIDPERDTPEVMADFTANVHPKMLGLTGSPEQVESAADAYKVYYAKQNSDDPDYYLMDHSAFTYLMTKGDRYLAIFRHGDTPEAIADSASCYLDAVAKGA